MKRFLTSLLSLIITLTLFGSNVVSASYISNANLNDGIVSAKLSKNVKLTNKNFKFNSNGYITKNNISHIYAVINYEDCTIDLSGDINVILSGEIEKYEENEYLGVFEGNIGANKPIIISATFSETNIFLAITIDYLGSLENETVFFGEYDNQMKKINEEKVNDIQLQLNETKELLYEKVDTLNLSKLTKAVNIDGDIVYQGGDVADITSNYPVGYLSIYHQEQMTNTDDISIFAKINTNSSNMVNYLKNYVYTSADYVYAFPETFDVSIIGKHTKFYIDDTTWMTPKSSREDFEVKLYYYNPIDKSIDDIDIIFNVSETTATLSRTTQGYYKAVWSIYKNYGWNQTAFDTTNAKNAQNGMGVKTRIEFNSSITSNTTANIETKATIRFMIRTITGEESESPIYYARTDEMSVISTLTILA